MKPKVMLVLGAALALLVGLALVLSPTQMMTNFGLTPSDAGKVLSRDMGVILLGIAVLNWMARDAGPGAARDAILVGNLLVQALSVVIDSYHVSTGAISSAGIGGIVFHALLGGGFALAIFRPNEMF